ncbi:MAG: hypothetical protein M1586_00125 [Patescibacteria group bacterium]|nr:hypothetical protein [Patescibacteria group bacterium]MCL5261697.1 hypothetical protein [Patescibacteria group bacterium]
MTENLIKSKNKLAAFWRLINPFKPVGGLSINDSSLKYVRIDENNRLIKASLRLPPGLIEGGRVKNRALTKQALETLKSYVVSPKGDRQANVIVSLQDNLVYSRIFTVPSLEEKALQEAALLNLQMISPIDLKQAYYSYQPVGIVANGGRQLELLGAFIPSSTADEWLSLLKEAGFSPIAIEFQSLSLTRAMDYLKIVDPKSTYVVLNVAVDGLNFAIIKNNNLYFDYFYPWKSVGPGGRQIAFADLEQVLFTEIERVLNFASSRFNTSIEKIFVFSEDLAAKISASIKSRFPQINTQEFSLTATAGLPADWSAVLGAAIRGAMPRSKDQFISLNAISVKEEYFQEQSLNLVDAWRSAFLVTLAFLAVLYSGSDLFLRRIKDNLIASQAISLPASENQEYSALRAQVDSFNSLVRLVADAKRQETVISPFLKKIKELAGTDATILRIATQPIDGSITLNASSPSLDLSKRFVDRLKATPQLQKVEQPLANLVVDPDGSVTFIVTFKVASENF